MAEIVNLRRFRKAAARAAESAAAAQNRLTFGRPKAERHAVETERGLSERRLEAHRRDAAALPDPPAR